MEQQNNKSQETELELDVREVFFALVQKWYLIGLAGFLFAAAAFCISKFVIPEKYESKTSIYILNQNEEDITYSDLQLGSTLTKDYEVLVESRTVLENAIDKLALDITYDELAGMVSVSVPDSTRIVEISVKTTDPGLSQQIADQVREIASTTITEVMKVDAVNVVEKANYPDKKCSPSVAKNTVLGGFIGVFIAGAVILLIVMFKDTICTQDDIEKYLNVSTLGVIPLDEELVGFEKKREIESRSRKTGKKK